MFRGRFVAPNSLHRFVALLLLPASIIPPNVVGADTPWRQHTVAQALVATQALQQPSTMAVQPISGAEIRSDVNVALGDTRLASGHQWESPFHWLYMADLSEVEPFFRKPEMLKNVLYIREMGQLMTVVEYVKRMVPAKKHRASLYDPFTWLLLEELSETLAFDLYDYIGEIPEPESVQKLIKILDAGAATIEHPLTLLGNQWSYSQIFGVTDAYNIQQAVKSLVKFGLLFAPLNKNIYYRTEEGDIYARLFKNRKDPSHVVRPWSPPVPIAPGSEDVDASKSKRQSPVELLLALVRKLIAEHNWSYAALADYFCKNLSIKSVTARQLAEVFSGTRPAHTFPPNMVGRLRTFLKQENNIAMIETVLSNQQMEANRKRGDAARGTNEFGVVITAAVINWAMGRKNGQPVTVLDFIAILPDIQNVNSSIWRKFSPLFDVQNPAAECEVLNTQDPNNVIVLDTTAVLQKTSNYAMRKKLNVAS